MVQRRTNLGAARALVGQPGTFAKESQDGLVEREPLTLGEALDRGAQFVVEAADRELLHVYAPCESLSESLRLTLLLTLNVRQPLAGSEQ